MGSTNTENTTPQCSVTLLIFFGEYSGSAVLTMGKMYTGCYEENIKDGLPRSQHNFFWHCSIIEGADKTLHPPETN